MKHRKKKQKGYEKAVVDAYNLLVSFRRFMEEYGHEEYAQEIDQAYKALWITCLDREPPNWGEPYCERG